jgi:hypothetical protein
LLCFVFSGRSRPVLLRGLVSEDEVEVEVDWEGEVEDVDAFGGSWNLAILFEVVVVAVTGPVTVLAVEPLCVVAAGTAPTV